MEKEEKSMSWEVARAFEAEKHAIFERFIPECKRKNI